MSNRSDFITMIDLVTKHRYQSDPDNLPEELNQPIHQNGGRVEFAYYQNICVCGFSIKTWEFEPTSTWLDLLKVFQTTFSNTSDIHNIVPNL
jgi:hypothetical protein